MGIRINLTKAKVIAHDKRRAAREAEMKPYDEVIMKQIPGNSLQAAESERQKIRAKYDVIQVNIDNAQTVEELKQAMTF